MKVATSFSSPKETIIHVRLSSQQREIIKPIHRSGQLGSAVSYASFLGYEKILWGPVEELVLGKKIHDQFINIENFIARAGSVGLYELKSAPTSLTAKN